MAFVIGMSGVIKILALPDQADYNVLASLNRLVDWLEKSYVLRQQTQTPAYWTGSFRVTHADIEYLFSQLLEVEMPLSSQELALRLIAHRLTQEEERLAKQVARGQIFQPKESYKTGQELIFPGLDFQVGKVVGLRDGQNNDYGDFVVLQVEFEDKQRREFASKLKPPHTLNMDETGGQRLPNFQKLDAQTIFEQHGEMIIEELEARLIDEAEAVFFAGKWFVRSLLADVNVGHLHLAEAILDISEGGPLAPAAFLNDLDFAKEVPQPVREFSLNVALGNDERFDDVGPAGQVQWFLRRLEPPEVLTTPARLIYHPIEYDHKLLTDELRSLERELDDEHSPFEPVATGATSATLNLNYPHRRVGTIPLTSRVAPLFPLAYESPRVRVTLIDNQSGNEFAGWVVREDKYVYGLVDFYRTHKLPIGAYLTVRTTDDPSRLILDFQAHRPHSEYIRLAVPSNNRLTFANFKRSIGAGYDELLILGAEEIDAVDAIWTMTRDRHRGLVEIMKDLIPELAKLNPQNAVHAKTLYSAVNVVRRCPPGPIFANLVARDDFQHVGGPYWRLATGG